MSDTESLWLWLSHISAYDLKDSSKSCLSHIGSIEPELFTILFKCPGRKKKEEEEEEEEEDLEFAPIDRRVAPVTTLCLNLIFESKLP